VFTLSTKFCRKRGFFRLNLVLYLSKISFPQFLGAPVAGSVGSALELCLRQLSTSFCRRDIHNIQFFQGTASHCRLKSHKMNPETRAMSPKTTRYTSLKVITLATLMFSSQRSDKKVESGFWLTESLG